MQAIKYQYIKVNKMDFRMEVILARPEKRNAFTPTTVNEIAHAFQNANDDDSVKVVVFKAEGPVFCAGMDLKTFENEDLDISNPLIENKRISLGEVFAGLYKPSVAMVEGNVIAGAFLIIAGCTYVFCSENVQFRLPELNLGIFPFQVMASLIKVMPEKKMLQLCLHTDYFSAREAMEYGLVDGFLEKIDTEGFLAKFKDISSSAVVAGFKAARGLPSVASEQRYGFLLKSLHELKSSEDVKNRIFRKE
ncbi:enoyl-CoA hydratase/isomerase family protein [Sphingobacterium corticibacterium]|uniref:Enoyl-CoA hydratase/isomerase family protein n=1 Tax=Sphingobacterium corticibacterium TaxID=2484746 RepID=A0A4Q6XS77_9SPHI|nr:enoyl-CoA hydratase/isomerase family protein [Sphingobacterium corticibacterium]RZF60314.1 enoyl-CoA hydratase/isomerase family protein [Sphingobacterium corticibacterium]